MGTIAQIFQSAFNFFTTTELKIFEFSITLWQLGMIAISFEVAYWLIQYWRSEHGSN